LALLRLQYVKKKPAPKPKRKVSKTSSKPGRRVGPKKAAGRGVVPARARHTESVRPVPSSPQVQREALAAARAAIDAALAKKALLPVLIDVSGRASYADYIAIVSGRSDRQVDAIADHVSQAMRERGRRLLGREGTRNGRWALLDFGDVVMHVFYHPVREVFDIESLWIDAPRVKLQVPPEAMVIASDGPVSP
jgi:ribosome-associated protein